MLGSRLQERQIWIDATDDPQQTRMRVQREKLPAFGHRKVVLDAVASDRVCVISGSTGCGKTTQIPQCVARTQHSLATLQRRLLRAVV